MTNTIELQLVSPDKLLVSEKVDMVTIPGGEGDFGVMIGHQPMITTVRPGILEIDNSTSEKRLFFVNGGFAEITNTTCVVLTDEAILLENFKRADIEARIEDIKIANEKATSDSQIEHGLRTIIVLEELLLSSN